MPLPASMRARALAGALVGLAAFGAFACQPVTTIPAELSGGVYCLTFDVAIDEVTPLRLYDNTTLDCQGHRIRDLAQTDAGVIAWGDNIVLKNCVVDGFGTQVLFTGATNYRIEGNTLVNGAGYSLIANGQQGLIARNIVIARVPRVSAVATAMEIEGVADVVGNIVIQPKDSTLLAGELRQGILSYGNNGGVISDNIVSTGASPGENGTSMSAGGRSLAYGNVLAATPGSNRSGITCYQAGSHWSNIIVGAQHPYVNCAIQSQVGLREDRHGR